MPCQLSARLAAGFNRNAADGKATLYRQAAATSADARYAIATEAMVEMFGSAPWQGHMARFLARKKRPAAPTEPAAASESSEKDPSNS